MSTGEIRPVRRSDRDQLTWLVNAHVQAVVPGISVSVNTVLSQLEREPGEFIVDPWVVDRATLVAEQRGRISAAAHVLRYGSGPEVGDSLRGVGEIRWLLCWPDAPYWPDAEQAGAAVVRAAVVQMRRWDVRRICADGSLPAPGVYGIPEQWPHIHALLEGVGFVRGDRPEQVLLAGVEQLPRTPAPQADLELVRTLGSAGTRFAAVLDGHRHGYIEVDTGIAGLGRVGGQPGWADIANLYVAPEHRRTGVGRWLLGEAAEWLRFAHVDRLLAYAAPEEQDELMFLRHMGFVVLTTTWRNWQLHA